MPDFDLRWAYGSPAQEEERFYGLLPAAEAGGDAEYHLGLLTQIARAQGLQQRFADAHATLDRVEALLTPALKSAPVRYLLERGRAFNSDGQRERAQPLFEQAFDLAMRAGEAYHAVDAAHMVAIASSEPDEQMAGEGLPARARIARWSIGKMLRLLGRLAEALSVQEQIAATGEADGYNAEEIGECLLALGRPTESRIHFARAYELLSQDPWLVRNEPARLARLKGLGE